MSFCFVHAADLHLDTPFSGLGAVSPELQAALQDASLEAWDALVALTIAEQAAFLFLAGDIYDGATRGVRAQLRFLQGCAGRPRWPSSCASGARQVLHHPRPRGNDWQTAIRRQSSNTPGLRDKG